MITNTLHHDIALIQSQIIAGQPPSMDTWMELLSDTLPLLEKLAKTPQDPEWHGEGDVRTHTAWVLREMGALLATEAAYLSDTQKVILTLAALCHDIGKPLTTKMLDGRIASPRHAERGCHYIAYRLPEIGLPYPLVREVMSLVRYHHNPKWLVTNDAGEPAYRRLARQVDTELVYWLERADVQGRLAVDTATQLESLALFRLFCEEYGVWSNRDPYADWREILQYELTDYPDETRAFVLATAIMDYEAEKIYTPYEAIAMSHQYRDDYGTLLLLVGPSGAGKSTWSDQHLEGYERISLDDLRTIIAGGRTEQSQNAAVVQAARNQMKSLLRQGKKVVWDATNLRRMSRDSLLAIGRDYQAYTRLAVFHLPVSAVHRQNLEREHAIPTDILTAQLDRAEWVDVTEGHKVTYVDVKQ